jgi:hypothetical protein
MTVKTLVHTVPNVTDLVSINLTESYSSNTTQAQITCYDTTLSLGDSISFNMGFSGDSGKVFTGYVKQIIKSLPDALTTIICEDELTKAVDYFLASNDPQAPFTRSNIKTEDLIEDILNEALITNYGHDVPLEVIWGTQGVVEFNLISAIQAAKQISEALAWHIYADRNGKVWLKDRPPYWKTGDSVSFTWNTASADVIMTISHAKSTEELRNRVVVYGLDNRFASASASSPYLPSGFYKTAVLASPIFDRTDLCQLVADYNLTRFNRLTESLQLQIIGNWQVEPRKFATVTDSYTGTSGDWFIFQVTHSFDSSGYIQQLTLVK